MNHTRRDVLLGATTVTVGGVAGCLETAGRDPGQAFASFFTLADFTRNVVGDVRSVDNAVPSGQHGHEWDPSTSILPSIVESEAFVYLDAEGFQPWIDEAIDEIESDHADDVILIDALEGIDLLEYDGHGHDHEDGRGHGHTRDLEIRSIDLIDRDTGTVVADAHGDHWHGGPLEIPTGGYRSLGADLKAEDGTAVDLCEEYTLDARVSDDAADVLGIDAHGDHVHVSAEEDGTTAVVIQVRHDGDVAWESPTLEVVAGDADDEVSDGGDDDHGHGHDHSHGEYDAKFYADPVLAQEGVRNVRDGFVDLDPDNAEYYRENAVAYIDRLQELHERFERRLADRDHDVVVLAGHDSFQYLGERYGFRIHTPVGLSPDHDPTPDQIAEAVELIESEGIEYVLWDYFDGDRAAEVIAAEVDHDVETVMVSPAESTTQEWLDEGIGSYVDQLEQITLPALETALGADGA